MYVLVGSGSRREAGRDPSHFVQVGRNESIAHCSSGQEAIALCSLNIDITYYYVLILCFQRCHLLDGFSDCR